MFAIVGLGAALGAVARFALTNYGKKHWMKQTDLPLPTLVINLTGSFLLGLLYALQVNPALYAFLGTGVLGGYTTFSTLNTELVTLASSKRKRTLKTYLLASYAGGMVLVTIGYFLGKLMQ